MDALTKAGCEKIHEDYASGVKTDRNGLEKTIESLRKGDTLVVWELDRLGISLKHLIEVINFLNKRGIYFKSIQESIDSSTSGGKLIFHVFGALAEFERDIIRERTLAGLAVARARGWIGGRPRKMDSKKRAYAKMLMESEENTVEWVLLYPVKDSPRISYLALSRELVLLIGSSDYLGINDYKV